MQVGAKKVAKMFGEFLEKAYLCHRRTKTLTLKTLAKMNATTTTTTATFCTGKVSALSSYLEGLKGMLPTGLAGLDPNPLRDLIEACEDHLPSLLLFCVQHPEECSPKMKEAVEEQAKSVCQWLHFRIQLWQETCNPDEGKWEDITLRTLEGIEMITRGEA